MKGRILNRFLSLLPVLIGTAIFLAIPSAARAAAANGGQPLPWEGPLNQVLASFTGPVAKALCILSIVVIGFGFAFSEGGGMRRMLGLLLGVSIAVTATSFGVAFFGFDGGAGW
jgi:type IV secretory pathway VirB2 component (pilin)